MSSIVFVSFARLSTLSVVGDKIFVLWHEPTPAVKMPEVVVHPWSHVPSFGGHCCPGVSRPVLADGDSSSSSSGPIFPSVFSNLTYTLDDGLGFSGQGLQQCCTVSIGVTLSACASSRLRFSTYYLVLANSKFASSSSRESFLSPSTTSIVFCRSSSSSRPRFSTGRFSLANFSFGIEIASLNAFTSDHKLWVNCSGVRGSGRLTH